MEEEQRKVEAEERKVAAEQRRMESKARVEEAEQEKVEVKEMAKEMAREMAKEMAKEMSKEMTKEMSREKTMPKEKVLKKKENEDLSFNDRTTEETKEPKKVKRKLERENTFTKEESKEELIKETNTATQKEIIEKELPSRQHTSLTAKSANKLDKIINSRGKSTSKDKEVKKLKQKPPKPLSKDVKSEEKKLVANDKNPQEKIKETKQKEEKEELVEKQPTPSVTKKRSILKSLSGKHVGSEESADLAATDKEVDTKEVVKPKAKPLSFMERSRQLLSKGSSKDDEQDKKGDETEEKKNKSEDQIRKGAADENIKSKTTVEQGSSDEEISDEDESLDSEEDSEEDDETEDDSGAEESTDDDDVTSATATEPTTTRGDTSASEAQAGQVLSVLPEVHRVETLASDSHDSEGVIVKKSPSAKKASVAGKDTIVIVVSDFEAAKDAAFTADERVDQVYVEYRFLDLPAEELETPFSLPKPAPQEKITFNFRKVIAMDRADNAGRRRLVSKMLRSEEEAARSLTFLVVSEPPDAEEDCRDLGEATLDLGTILRTGQDLEDKVLEVVGRDQATVLGTLTVSVFASQAFKSITP